MNFPQLISHTILLLAILVLAVFALQGRDMIRLLYCTKCNIETGEPNRKCRVLDAKLDELWEFDCSKYYNGAKK